MNNRTSLFVIGGLILLAIIGIISSFSTNPARFIQGIAVTVLVCCVIYFVVRKFSVSSPQKKEQRAFLRAARKSKKRLMQKSGESNTKNSALGTLSPLKRGNKIRRKTSAHLTVIEGKKGKNKKNRASF